MKSRPRSFLRLAALTLAVSACGAGFNAGAAAGMELRIATVAPAGSSFHKRLQALGNEWSHGAGGVSMNIYAGTQGGELQIVRRMRVGQIQGAMLSSVGLAQIERSVTALQYMPMMFRDWDDVDAVREKLRPDLERRLNDAGYVVMFWADAGWVRFFGKKPFVTPDDLRKLKLFTWAGSPQQVEIYKSAGFNPVPLETADILPGLQTGLIEAVPAPPADA